MLGAEDALAQGEATLEHRLGLVRPAQLNKDEAEAGQARGDLQTRAEGVFP